MKMCAEGISRKKRGLAVQEKVLAFIQEKGLKGVRESGARNYFHLNRLDLQSLSQRLEEEGRIKIISFSPLFLLSKESFDFLCQKILSCLTQHHKNHPLEKGVSLQRMKKQFDLPQKILFLALKTLVHLGQLREEEGIFALSGFTRLLTPREEKLLGKLEEMCFKGEFRSVSLKEVEAQLYLPAQKLQQMLSLLVERNKVVQGKDGFFLHARWLEDLIERVKRLGKNELTVSDFKTLTGLSRKYAIPLLELLDELGITRRKGPLREILRSGIGT